MEHRDIAPFGHLDYTITAKKESTIILSLSMAIIKKLDE
jgi:hypothetical protein